MLYTRCIYVANILNKLCLHCNNTFDLEITLVLKNAISSKYFRRRSAIIWNGITYKIYITYKTKQCNGKIKNTVIGIQIFYQVCILPYQVTKNYKLM